MKLVYKMDTWSGRNDLNQVAIEAAKQYSGRKFSVAIGEWGTTTYLVFADSKDDAREKALAEYDGSAKGCHDERVKVREVTNCKKYN